MGELTKAQLADKVSELELQIEKLTSEAGLSEVIAEKEAVIAELTAKVEELTQQAIEQSKVIEELSKDNATASTSGDITHEGVAYKLLAPKFHMGGIEVSAETLKGNSELIAKAIELKLLVTA